jgi:Family of unknown function (DUF6328)
MTQRPNCGRKQLADEGDANEERREQVPLSRAAQYLLEECRMVLPGIQALFGFQLIAVFSPGFAQKLTLAEQRLHLVAIALLAIAVALIMAPAAYHRQRGPQEVTRTFIHLATRLLLWSMVPLALSICIEFYLVGRVIEDGAIVPLGAGFLFAVFVGLWFVLPHVRSSKWTGSKRERTS